MKNNTSITYRKNIYKYFHALLIGLLLVSCTKETREEPTKGISAETIQSSVTFLASDDLNGRKTGSGGIDTAASYIESEFKSYGVKPYFDTYRDSFAAKDLDAFNVVGFLEGADAQLKDEVIILSAHYDHIGSAEMIDDDSLANGANDNASSVSAVMSLAQYFASERTNKRSLMFVLFSAEEMGLLGSKDLSAKLKSQNLNLYTVLNFEMIGVPMKDKEYQAYITGFDLSNMADKINEYAGNNLVGFLPKAGEFRLFMRSDNYPFYADFNIPAQTVSTFDFTNYDYYHHVDDEAEYLDYEHMATLLNNFIPAIEGISNASHKEIMMHE